MVKFLLKHGLRKEIGCKWLKEVGERGKRIGNQALDYFSYTILTSYGEIFIASIIPVISTQWMQRSFIAPSRL